jgi:HEAT repeat protein
LLDLLKDGDSAVRRWGAISLLALRENAAPAAEALVAALKDPSPDVRMTAAEALLAMRRGDIAMPVLIELLAHESRIIRNETLLTLCRIGKPASAALPHLEQTLGPSRHTGIWSYDDIRAAISLARSCLSDQAIPDGVELPLSKTHPVPASDRLRTTRQKYLP